MRKILKICLLACIGILASCTKGSYADLVPKDATLVAAVRLDRLVEDADLAHSSLMNSADEYLGLIAQGKDLESLREFVDDPTVIGLDFSKPAYVFGTPAKQYGLVLKVEDSNRLDAFFAFMHKLQIASKPTEKEHLMWLDVLDDFHVAYNDLALLLLISAEGNAPASALKQLMASLFGQKSEDSFSQQPCCQAWEDCERHIQLFERMEALPQSWNEWAQALLPNGIRAADVQLKADVSFEVGEAVVNAMLLSENEAVQKKLEEQTKNQRPIQGAFLQMLPEDFLAFATFGCEGERLIETLKSHNTTKQRLFLIERAIDIEAIVRAVDGDVAVLLPQAFLDNPHQLTTVAQLKSTVFMSDFNYWKQTAKDYRITLSQTDKNQYRISADDLDVFWGIDETDKPSTIYFATSDAFRQQAFSRKSDYLKKYNDLITSSDCFACLNMAQLSPLVSKDGGAPPYIASMLKSSDLLIFNRSLDGQLTIRLIAKDPSVNLLKQLF